MQRPSHVLPLLTFFVYFVSGCAASTTGVLPATGLPPSTVTRDASTALPQNLVPPAVGITLPSSSTRTAKGFEVVSPPQNLSAPVSTPELTSANGGITLNFIDANVTAVAQTIFGQVLKQNYTVDGGVQGTITLQTTQPITLDAVIPALETSLQMANLALIREADGYHIVPLANAPQAGAGDVSIAGGPQIPGYGYEIIPLKYADAESIQRLVQPLAQPGVQIEADAAHNLLIVGGNSEDRSAIAANVAIYDVDWLAGMSYELVPLQNASASSVSKEIDEIINGSGDPMGGLVRLVVIGQLNAVLVVTRQPQYLAQMRSWIQRLDQQEQSDERQVFIYEVQNGRASEIASTLNTLFHQAYSNGDRSSAEESGADDTDGENSLGGGNSDSDQPQQQSQTGTASSGGDMAFSGTQSSGSFSPGPSGASPSGLDEGASQLLDQNVSPQQSDGGSDSGQPPEITADDNDNDLLIYGTEGQYQSLEAALLKLDVEPRQIMLEAVVAEVTLTNQLQYGVQYFFQSGRVQSVNTLGTINAVSQILPGFSAILSPGQNIQIALNALESITHVNVISAPRLLVLNNQSAELQVGDEVPITTQTAQSTETGSAPIVSTVEYQPTGVILNVKPRINAGGLVTLDISQEVSEVSTTTTSTLNSPTITERKISTIVAVPDGQTVALGGLIQTNGTTDNSGIPILGRIPLLGVLFSNRDTSRTRTELLVMITPHVVESASALQTVTTSLRNELYDTMAAQ